MENIKISDTEMKVVETTETTFSKKALEGEKEILENQLADINQKLKVFT